MSKQIFNTWNPTQLEEIVREYGTPLYVYDSAIMEQQFDRMINAFSVPNLKINFACKALNNINVLKLFRSKGSGLDAVSIQEVWLGLKAGFSPADIIYTPNSVSMEEIALAVKAGVRINIDNISILEEFGNHFPHYPIGIRVNPHIMAGGNSKISVGHIDSKFGISVHQFPHVQRVVQAQGLKVEGLHMHTGSDILDLGVFYQGADILFELAKDFPELDYIDFGSGFKVPYRIDDPETDIEEFGKGMTKKFSEFTKTYGRDLQLIFEPGKYLVSESGVFLARVNVLKQTTAALFAGLDTGLNHFIRPMFYDAFHQIENVSNPNGKGRIYTCVGYICETDTFASDRKISEIRVGDILAFKNAGAYCFSMASNYNSRFRPAEVLIHNGDTHLIRKRETFDDILTNMVEIDL